MFSLVETPKEGRVKGRGINKEIHKYLRARRVRVIHRVIHRFIHTMDSKQQGIPSIAPLRGEGRTPKG